MATVCAIAAVLCLAAALARPSRRRLPAELARLATLGPRELDARRDAARPVWERLLDPVVSRVARRVRPGWAGMSVDDLRRAGIDTDRFGLSELLAVKLLCAGVGAAVAMGIAVLVPGAILLLPAITFAGFVAPSIVITRRRVSRHRAMLRELPDLVGLLKAFVTAGVALEQALHLISAQQAATPRPNPLSLEVRRALADYGLGMSIEQALDAMARRTGVEEVQLLAGALSQGKRQGAGMERILRDQEQVVRMGQRNRAAAEASRVGTRLVGVLVLVYLPEFMVLIMVPLFYGIFLKAFG
jgi:Flp pilus assembly protein TadB